MGQYTQFTGTHSTEDGTVYTIHRDTLHRGWDSIHKSPGHTPQRMGQYTQLTGTHSTEDGTEHGVLNVALLPAVLLLVISLATPARVLQRTVHCAQQGMHT